MKEEYYKNTYKEISELSNTDKCRTTLIQNQDTNELVVKKEMPSEMFDVYSKLANINHDGIVKVLSCYIEGDKCVDIEEYVNGSTLESLVAQEQLQTNVCVDYILNLCDTLMVLHGQGIIHRDIQPKNIIIENGKAKLIDFDIARNKKEKSDKDTRLLGTPEYASPEAYGFSQTDERSDIYSLGKVLELLVKDERFKPIIEKCTQMDPKNRYQSAGELKMALLNSINGGVDNKNESLLKTIPGFRSDDTSKKTVAICIYAIVLVIWTGTALQAKGNLFVKLLSVLLFYCWLLIPYAFLMNIGNISSKLIRAKYKTKRSEWLVRIALCIISFIIIFIPVGFFVTMH